jgi:hypothetical protein
MADLNFEGSLRVGQGCLRAFVTRCAHHQRCWFRVSDLDQDRVTQIIHASDVDRNCHNTLVGRSFHKDPEGDEKSCKGRRLAACVIRKFDSGPNLPTKLGEVEPVSMKGGRNARDMSRRLLEVF